jgi:hypothetical protein
MLSRQALPHFAGLLNQTQMESLAVTAARLVNTNYRAPQIRRWRMK